MKRIIVMSLIGASAFLTSVCAETVMGKANYKDKTFTEALKIMGPLSATRITTQDIEVMGGAKLTDAKINGEVRVTGPATLVNVEIKAKTKITGPLRANKTHFSQAVQVVGPLHATDTTFLKDVSCYGEAALRGSEVKGDLIVQGNENSSSSYEVTQSGDQSSTVVHKSTSISDSISEFFFGKPKVTVVESITTGKNEPIVRLTKTVVHGSVIFKGTKGEVILDESSKINGKIINGEIKKQKA